MRLWINIILLLLLTFALFTDAEARVNKKADFIESVLTAKLEAVRKVLLETRDTYIKILNSDSIKPVYDFSIYEKNKPEDVFTDHNHVSKSVFYISHKTIITKDIINFIKKTEHLEDLFANNLEMLPDLGWQFIYEYQNRSMRLYPWFNAQNIMGNDINWDEVEIINKGRGIKSINDMVCSSPTMDFAGLGVIVTCAVPIFSNNKLYGLVGSDIQINETFESSNQYLGNSLNEFSFIVSAKRGLILLKPIYYEYFFNNTSSIKDLDCNDKKHICRLNNQDYTYNFIEIRSKYLKQIRLMNLTKI
jgi:hypothetical protein